MQQQKVHDLRERRRNQNGAVGSTAKSTGGAAKSADSQGAAEDHDHDGGFEMLREEEPAGRSPAGAPEQSSSTSSRPRAVPSSARERSFSPPAGLRSAHTKEDSNSSLAKSSSLAESSALSAGSTEDSVVLPDHTSSGISLIDTTGGASDDHFAQRGREGPVEDHVAPHVERTGGGFDGGPVGDEEQTRSSSSSSSAGSRGGSTSTSGEREMGRRGEGDLSADGQEEYFVEEDGTIKDEMKERRDTDLPPGIEEVAEVFAFHRSQEVIQNR